MSEIITTQSDAQKSALTLEELTELAIKHVKQGNALKDEMLSVGRRSLIEYYHAGWAFDLIEQRLKPVGKWVAWQLENKLNRGTVNKIIHLYRNCTDKHELEKVKTLQEAFERFGVRAKKVESKIITGKGKPPVTAPPQPVIPPSVDIEKLPEATAVAPDATNSLTLFDDTEAAKEHLAASFEIGKSFEHRRMSIICLHRAGAILLPLQQNLGKEFESLIESCGVTMSTAMLCIELATKVQSENEIVVNTLTDACWQYGINDPDAKKGDPMPMLKTSAEALDRATDMLAMNMFSYEDVVQVAERIHSALANIAATLKTSQVSKAVRASISTAKTE